MVGDIGLAEACRLHEITDVARPRAQGLEDAEARRVREAAEQLRPGRDRRSRCRRRHGENGRISREGYAGRTPRQLGPTRRARAAHAARSQ